MSDNFSNPSAEARPGLRGWEWLLITLILLAGFVLRAAHFSDVPPGVIHDEVRNWLNVQLITAGDIRALYPYGGGREALYLFIQAASFKLIGDNMLAARWPSIMFSMIGIAASYALARRLFGRPAGWVTAAGWASSFWALMFARLAVRTASMPAMGLVVTYFYLRLLQDGQPPLWRYVLAGLVLGATLYTYPSALIFPIILIAWICVVALQRRDWLRSKWLPLGLSFVVTALTAIPLARAWADPSNIARADEVNAPLEALLGGDLSPTLANIRPIMGVFSVQGDHGLEFNLQDQPIFPTVPMAIFFYLGVIWSVMGLFRKGDNGGPGFALALLWLAGMLVPTLVTERPVNPSRTIGLLGIVYMFPGVAAAQAQQLARRASRGGLSIIVIITVALGLFIQLDQTIGGYFSTWAGNPVVKFLYQDDYRALATDLDNQPGSVVPTAVGGLTSEKLDPASMRLLMADDTKASSLGFFDPQTALLLPQTDGFSDIVVPHFVTLHPSLQGLLLYWDSEVTRHDAYTHYRLDHAPTRPSLEGEREPFYLTGNDMDEPLVFLLDIEWDNEPEPGKTITLLTLWRATGPSEVPLRIFVHFTDQGGEILSQSDVLGVPSTQWRGGDLIVQAHDLSLNTAAPPDPYYLNIGLYDPITGQRLLTHGGDSAHLEVFP